MMEQPATVVLVVVRWMRGGILKKVVSFGDPPYMGITIDVLSRAL
jgi:hypothetical protein